MWFHFVANKVPQKAFTEVSVANQNKMKPLQTKRNKPKKNKTIEINQKMKRIGANMKPKIKKPNPP